MCLNSIQLVSYSSWVLELGDHTIIVLLRSTPVFPVLFDATGYIFKMSQYVQDQLVKIKPGEECKPG